MKFIINSIIILLILVASFTLTAKAQQLNSIVGRCPNQSAFFGSVVIDRLGNIISTPCPNGIINFGNQTTGLAIDTDANQVFSFGVVNWTSVTAWSLNRAITPIGTTGNITINRLAGTVNVAPATMTVTVTNNTVDVNSIVFTVARTNDSTCAVKNIVPASGSFTVNMTTNCTAATSIGFLVTN